MSTRTEQHDRAVADSRRASLAPAATVQVTVIDGHTVQVSGLSPQEVVNRLQRNHPSDRLTIAGTSPVLHGVQVARVARDTGLSEREVEILRRITCGESTLKLADHLSLSVDSVRTYIRSAYRKLGLRSRSQAVMWGIQHGLSPSPSNRPLTQEESQKLYDLVAALAVPDPRSRADIETETTIESLLRDIQPGWPSRCTTS
jgi:DNA-binding CsgD family transcriptional regulator